jgi:hypothetical protein
MRKVFSIVAAFLLLGALAVQAGKPLTDGTMPTVLTRFSKNV